MGVVLVVIVFVWEVIVVVVEILGLVWIWEVVEMRVCEFVRKEVK